MNDLLRRFFAPGVPSDKWALNKYDFIKGFVLSVFAPAILMVTESLNKYFSGNDPLVIDWRMLGKVAGSCFLGYILKNFVSPSSNPPMK